MTIPASDITIAYDDVGSGIPLVFLHGFPHNRTLWTPQLGGLFSRARCIALDLRGFGDTPAVPPYSMDRYADDVAELLTLLHLERAVIVGLSMGGYVAFAMWRRYPQMVRALVLADTRAGSDTEEGREKRRALIEVARSRGSLAVADAQMPGMIGKTTREKRPDLTEAMHRMLSSAPVGGIVGALEAMMSRPDSTPTLATITVPTLIVAGEEDALISPAESRAMHAAIAGSRLEILEHAGHVSNFERPAAFNHIVSEFLGALSYA